jgi:hypothetical protein
VTEPDRAFDQEPLAVGAPMAEDITHELEARLLDDLSRIQLDDTDDPAHRLITSLANRAADGAIAS